MIATVSRGNYLVASYLNRAIKIRVHLPNRYELPSQSPVINQELQKKKVL